MNNSYYPLPIGAYGSPSRSPPPLRCHFPKPGRSEPAGNKNQLPTRTSSVAQEDTADTEHCASETSFVKHPDLWFPDGSIVLRAENTLFRVHKSLLARHSGFFHDLFSLPQPVGQSDTKSLSKSVHASGEIIEDCEVLLLHDASEDVSNLLTALVDGPTFGNNGLTDFQVVSGVLRLATKYVVDSLRQRALDHLAIAWPSTLQGWDAREDISRSFELQGGSECIYPSPIAVINLAREVDAPSLLPSAFYDLSRYSFAQIFDNSESFEEEEDGGSGSGGGVGSSGIPWQCPLSPIDMQRLSLGKEASQHAITTLIQSLGSHARALMTSAGPANVFAHHSQPHRPHPHQNQLHTRSSSYAHGLSHAHPHRTCKRDFSELVTLATQHYLFDRERGCTDPLYVAEELGQSLYDLSPLGVGVDRLAGGTAATGSSSSSRSLRSFEQAECSACARTLETWAKKEKERMWKMIPLWFRLDM